MMNSSSPAHSSVSAGTIAGAGGRLAGSIANSALASDDNPSLHFPSDHISIQDEKDEALLVLKSDLMAALHKEVKSLDEDNWKFAGPRSQIHLISRPGGLLHKKTETAKQWILAPPK